MENIKNSNKAINLPILTIIRAIKFFDSRNIAEKQKQKQVFKFASKLDELLLKTKAPFSFEQWTL
jgi:hypothetical protein